MSSGRDALMIALMAMGVKAGDAVFVPAFTFAATAGAVASIGATPVFVDVEPATFNMDPADLERAIAETAAAGGLVPRVVMPVDLYGLPADYPAIAAVAARHGLEVLADAAQSFGGRLGNVRVGALAPVSATSFYPTKPLGCYGDGGAMLTESPDDRRSRAHDPLAWPFRHRRRGHAARAHRPARHPAGGDPPRQARGLRQRARAAAARSPSATARRCGTPSSCRRCRRHMESAFALYTIRTPNRDAVRAALEAKEIGTGLFYRLALHQHPAFRDLPVRPLPNSEQLANEVLSLPIHPDLADDEVDRVIEAVLAAV